MAEEGTLEGYLILPEYVIREVFLEEVVLKLSI